MKVLVCVYSGTSIVLLRAFCDDEILEGMGAMVYPSLAQMDE